MNKPLVAAVAAGAAVLSAAAGAPSSAAPRARAVRFGAPVQVTPALGGGYEPTVVADRFGNLFATAHKENAQLALSPDPRSGTNARSMSWAWYSADDGRSWRNLPLGPDDVHQYDFGVEGDMAVDDAGHLYFVDTHVTDVSFTRWSVTGRGRIAHEVTSPLLGAGQTVDDRPWITAHGDGVVFYLGNQGDKVTYPAGKRGDGDAYGPGRYTVYPSYDGGRTWDNLGYTLADSGWCRPAADHRKGSKWVYVACTNDGGANHVTDNPGDEGHDKGVIWLYASGDDGRTFTRRRIGSYNAMDSWWHYPTVEVGPDGTVWVLYSDGVTPDCEPVPAGGRTCLPVSARLRLYKSTNNGRSWTSWDVTPRPGQYRYPWHAVSPDGRTIGFATYYRPSKEHPWRVYATAFVPGQRPTLTSLDEANPVAAKELSSPPGDYLWASYSPDRKLNVMWTRNVVTARTPVASALLYRDIYFARQLQ